MADVAPHTLPVKQAFLIFAYAAYASFNESFESAKAAFGDKYDRVKHVTITAAATIRAVGLHAADAVKPVAPYAIGAVNTAIGAVALIKAYAIDDKIDALDEETKALKEQIENIDIDVEVLEDLCEVLKAKLEEKVSVGDKRKAPPTTKKLCTQCNGTFNVFPRTKKCEVCGVNTLEKLLEVYTPRKKVRSSTLGAGGDVPSSSSTPVTEIDDPVSEAGSGPASASTEADDELFERE